jgi:molecular chaperone GrpE
MKFWEKMKNKEDSKKAAAGQAESMPEMTALEKRLAEKAALETDDETTEGPVNLGEAQEQIDELNNRVMRLTADYDNYRKRAQREKNEARQFANQGLLEDLIPVLDNFEMAISAAKEIDPSIKDGVQMIYDQLFNVLKESGMEPIDAVGKEFDPNLHEALSQEETAEAEEGTVVKQAQLGYKLNDRLVRPARVVVAKSPEVTADE